LRYFPTKVWRSPEASTLPIVISVPPYHFWEPPSAAGPLPTHGADFGLFMVAEVLGMRKIIFVKDVDGLYDSDPKKNPNAKLIKKTTLAELSAHMPKEVCLDEQLFTVWRDARHVQRVQIVNGLKRGELTRALAGEEVGTVIDKEPRHA